MPKMDSPSNGVNIVIYDEKVKTERAVTLSEAWMIDDVGKMDPDSEDENDSSLLTRNSHNIDREQEANDNKETYQTHQQIVRFPVLNMSNHIRT